MSVALNIADIIKESVPERDLPRILTVRIDIGLLSNISDESLLSCFNSVKENTLYHTAELVIKKLPLSIKCNSCGKISEKEELFFRCSYCSSDKIEVIGGNELNFSEIIIGPPEDIA
jgi:hydrogenase nickel incorporation protein HypA/HybF